MSGHATGAQRGAAGPELSGTGFGSALMARALAALFGAGATLALLTVLLPHSPHVNDAALLVIVAIAYVIANGTVGTALSALSSTPPNAGFALRDPAIAPARIAALS